MNRRRAVIREMLRNRWFVALISFTPIALGLQFLGDRDVIEIVLGLFVIALSAGIATRSTYRLAVDVVEDQILAAEHADWIEENRTRRSAGRHVA